MTERGPQRADPLTGAEAPLMSWSEARQRLADGRFYWLATTHPDGHPHVRSVLGVWLDGSLYSTTNPTAFKARNLRNDPRCAVTLRNDDVDLVLEGDASWIRDDATLRRVADVYASKYGWPVTVRHGAYDAPYGAPTAGPPPYDLYEIRPNRVFAFGTDETQAPRSTRWTF